MIRIRQLLLVLCAATSLACKPSQSAGSDFGGAGDLTVSGLSDAGSGPDMVGRSWRMGTVTPPAGTHAILDGVGGGPNPGDPIYIVGRMLDSATATMFKGGLILRADAPNWGSATVEVGETSVSAIGYISHPLLSVSVGGASSDIIYAVGQAGLAMRKEGAAAWSVVTTSVTDILWAVATSQAGDAHAGGVNGHIVHLSGSGAGAMLTAQDLPTTDSIFGIWKSSTATFASGAAGKTWSIPSSGAPTLQGSEPAMSKLYSLAGRQDPSNASHSDLIAVGPAGLAFVGTATDATTSTWSVKQTPVMVDLSSVSMTPTEGYAVGAGGTLLKTVDKGATWTTQPPLGNTDLIGIFARSDVVVVIGRGPVVWYF